MTRQFAVSFDYRCPFARNGHESVVAGLRAGRDWDVRSCRSRSTRCTSRRARRRCGSATPTSGAPACSAAVGHRRPRLVPRPVPRLAHRRVRGPPRRGRQDRQGRSARARSRRRSGSTPTRSRPRSRGPAARRSLADEHTEAVKRWHDVRRADVHRRRHAPCSSASWTASNPDDVDRVLDLLEWTDLNEFKHTSVPR